MAEDLKTLWEKYIKGKKGVFGSHATEDASYGANKSLVSFCMYRDVYLFDPRSFFKEHDANAALMAKKCRRRMC